jgi:tetratricopeptide (TPR) repeat protein
MLSSRGGAVHLGAREAGPVDLAGLLERISTGLTSLVKPAGPARPRSAAALFRQADRCRQDGRYDESRRLIAAGLRQQPESGTGHLLAAYLALVQRDLAAARASFQRVLERDPHHPRALLGLARIAFEAGDAEGSRRFVAQALDCYPDFPDAQALRDLLDGWRDDGPDAGAPAARLEQLVLPDGARELVLSRADSVLIARAPAERQRALALHVAQVGRLAASALVRCGLGALERAAVDSGQALTVLRAHAADVLSLTFPGGHEQDAALRELDGVWESLGMPGGERRP